jgi:tetratricopeptide (TPR) repeat protein
MSEDDNFVGEGPAPASSPSADFRSRAEAPQVPAPSVEIIGPTPVLLHVEPGRLRPAMATLTTDALWVQETWQVREVPLRTLSNVEKAPRGHELILTLGPGPATETLTLAFPVPADKELWLKELRARQPLTPEAPSQPADPRGVSLVVGDIAVPHEEVARVEYTAHSRWSADRGLQLLAARCGADAVLRVYRMKCTDGGKGARHVSGLAVRVEDAAARDQLRARWYDQEVCSLVRRMLLLLLVQVTLLLMCGIISPSRMTLTRGTGETPAEALASTAFWLGVLFAWPVVMLGLLRLLRWPGLLRATGLAVLAATSGRGLCVTLVHTLAVLTTGAELTGTHLWVLLDPVDWGFIIAGAMLCRRAWQLAADAPDMLPPEASAVPPARAVWARVLFGAAVVYGVSFLGFLGSARYQTSAYLLQPGVDPKREHQALLALNRGTACVDRGDLDGAESAFQESLRMWEDLTKGRSVPTVYRVNHALVAYNLAWLYHKKERLDRAEELYAKVVAIGGELQGNPEADGDHEQRVAEARRVLDAIREDRTGKLLDEKDQLGVRKYEESQVKADQGAPEAEGLLREAIALWEEVLPRATARDYRKFAVKRLADAYLLLAEMRQQFRRGEPEPALRKAIEYGERAVKLQPDRPLVQHNLEMARRALDRLREQAFQEEISKLYKAGRYADAVTAHSEGVAEQEKRLKAGQDRELASRSLAYRLSQFSWFLAHCPDDKVRDPKAAVQHAKRATELQRDVGDYWYTLATAQYRNGEWKDSLASIEKMKTRGGDYDAFAWLLIAMNRQLLAQDDEARAALRKADEWVEERKRQGQDNLLLRLQYETARPALEALRREAGKLLGEQET